MARPKKATAVRPKKNAGKETATFTHPEAELLIRPEIGAQARFRKKKPPQKYRYDDSLDPEMQWDEKNPARELGEWLLAQIEEASRLDPPHQFPEQRQFGESGLKVHGLTDAVRELRALGRPFLNWAGKAERTSFEVPTLPLFVHERLSTKAILETLKSHRRDKQESFIADLFADPRLSLTDQLTKAYEHPEPQGWKNRMILGDSLVVMNSLLRYESLGGQAQMIYMDPPYGVKFGSNFQPFVRKRDVAHGDDEHMTREPEMVQAYRDTWELGLHSYLTYLRDRLYLAKELLSPSGSIFVQISDENLHHVREVMDEVFGADNFVSVVAFYKTTGQASTILPQTKDFLVWYAKDRKGAKFRQLFLEKDIWSSVETAYDWIESPSGERRPLSNNDRSRLEELVQQGWKICALSGITSSGSLQTPEPDFEFAGRKWRPPAGSHWKTTVPGMEILKQKNRLAVKGNSLRYVRYFNDFPVYNLDDVWTDVAFGGFVSAEKLYVVQTANRVIERCILMTTDPGDLVLDPTCGSGTTAYVAEQWGRRWITCDTSRVPLALARQRLLTATLPYYQLHDAERGPASGFVYKRKQNAKGEEVGGIVPHITLKSIANNEPPKDEVLVDRPELIAKVTRVTGPFVVEATIPTAASPDDIETATETDKELAQTYHERMLETLRRAPVLRLPGNQTLTLKNIRPPAKTLTLAAEASIEAPSLHDLSAEAEGSANLVKDEKLVAIVFGPENGPVTERLVREAHDEASMKSRGYTHLYVIGFAIQPSARAYIDAAGQLGIPATYLSASMDLQMGDLLKHMRSSQIFSVVGQPDVRMRELKDGRYEVDVSGLDTFDPATMEALHLAGDDLPAWFLDTDYNGLCFHVCQAFFPRTQAWDSIKRAVGADFEATVWDHLAGTSSAPFEAGEQKQIALK
ncbi:site-specific DNA-methyltransferase [soil metagenome]